MVSFVNQSEPVLTFIGYILEDEINSRGETPVFSANDVHEVSANAVNFLKYLKTPRLLSDATQRSHDLGRILYRDRRGERLAEYWDLNIDSMIELGWILKTQPGTSEEIFKSFGGLVLMEEAWASEAQISEISPILAGATFHKKAGEGFVETVDRLRVESGLEEAEAIRQVLEGLPIVLESSFAALAVNPALVAGDPVDGIKKPKGFFAALMDFFG